MGGYCNFLRRFFLPLLMRSWIFSRWTDTKNIQGLGDQRVLPVDPAAATTTTATDAATTSTSSLRTQKVGAGGWGGGVHLATSDPATQEVNRVNLERFLKRQRRLKERRERQQQEEPQDKANN